MEAVAMPVEVVGEEEPVREVGEVGLPVVPGIGLVVPESEVEGEVVPNQSQAERATRGTSKIPLHK